MKEKEIYKIARRRANAKIGFYIHFTVYIFVMLSLASINFLFTPQFPWFVFPLFGWGIGVAIQAAIVFVALNSDLKRRMIERELRQLNEVSKLIVETPAQNYAPMNWKDA